MATPSSPPAAWESHLEMNRFPSPFRSPTRVLREEVRGEVKTTMPPFRTALVGRCGFPIRKRTYCLLEEGCHSAGFVTTIHLRHHLLLSIGWRFSLFAPVRMLKVCHISFRMSMGGF